jgi:asparagine synthase (glutamine-hydrolysing)
LETVLPLTPTLLEGVYQLCCGQRIAFSLECPSRSRFVQLAQRPCDVPDALSQSIREQSMADVEVGVQLSGGLDSSLVAYEFAKTRPRVHGFHISVAFPKHNEEKWARLASDEISKICDFRFHIVPATEEEVRRVLPDAIWYMDEPPLRHPAVVGVYLLSEYVRRNTNVKVLLSGEGADELFGGYSWHDGKTWKDFDRSRRLFDLGGSDRVRDFLPAPSNRKDILRCQLAYDRAIYLPMLLARQDRMSMAHSIETRVPFLSNRFLAMPPPAAPGKVALRREAAWIFGRKFARRPKFGSPFPRRWFAHLPIQREYLGWLSEPWQDQTKNEHWALAGLSAWSQVYLHGGWRTRVHTASSQAPSAPEIREASARP